MGGFLSALAGAGEAAKPYNTHMLDLWQQSRGKLAQMIQETRDTSVHDPALYSELTKLLGDAHKAKPGADQSKLTQRFQELTTVHPANINLMKQAGVPGADREKNPPPPLPGPTPLGAVAGGPISPIQGMQPDGSVVAAQPATNPIAGGAPIRIPPVGSSSPTLDSLRGQAIVPPALMRMLQPVINDEFRQAQENREWDARERIASNKNAFDAKVVGNALVAVVNGKAEVLYQGKSPEDAASRLKVLNQGDVLFEKQADGTYKEVAKGQPKESTVKPPTLQGREFQNANGEITGFVFDPSTGSYSAPKPLGNFGKPTPPQSPGQFIPFFTPGNDTPSFFNPKTDAVKTIPGITGTVTLKPETPLEKTSRALTTVTLNNFDKISKIAERNQDVFGPISGRVSEAKTKYTSRAKAEVVDMQRMLNQAKADIRQAATGLAFSDKETQEIIDRLPTVDLPYNSFVARIKGVGEDLRTKGNITSRGIIPPVGGAGVKSPTRDDILKYSRKFGGDKAKAKAAMIADGYTF